MAFEIHPRMAKMTNSEFYEIFLSNFKNTHKLVRTFCGGGGPGVLDNSSLILVKNDIYEENLKDIVNYLSAHPHSSQHKITLLN